MAVRIGLIRNDFNLFKNGFEYLPSLSCITNLQGRLSVFANTLSFSLLDHPAFVRFVRRW